LEVLTPLAHICGSLGCDRISIERAFDVVGGRGVRAIGSRLKRWVAFKVDIEAKAVLLAVAGISTALNVVSLVSLVGQVANLLRASALVYKGLLVTGRGSSISSNLTQLSSRGECRGSVR
jgi:hypothetical protein